MKHCILILFFLGIVFTTYAQTPSTTTPNTNYVSFEVNADSSATFRLYAPDAKTVALGGDVKGEKIERSNDGLWTIVTGPHLTPSVYSEAGAH